MYILEKWLTRLQPEQATKILAKILPPTIDFYRTPVVAAAAPKRVSPSIPSGSALSAAAAAAASERAAREAKEASTKPGEKVGIYGSVSTGDIAANFKALLVESTEGKHISFSSDNISIVGETQEKDRIKHLGSFEIEIKLNDSKDTIRRRINVKAQD